MLSGRMAMPAEPGGFERFDLDGIVLFLERSLKDDAEIEFVIPQDGEFVLRRAPAAPA